MSSIAYTKVLRDLKNINQLVIVIQHVILIPALPCLHKNIEHLYLYLLLNEEKAVKCLKKVLWKLLKLSNIYL